MSATFLLLFLGGSIFFSRAEGRMMELQQQSKLKDTSSGISQKTNEDSEHEVFLRQLHNQSGIAGFLLEHEPGSILDDNWDASTVEEATQSAEDRNKDLVQPHEVNLEGVPVIISQPKKVYYAWEGRPAVFECVAEPVSHAVVLCADQKFPFMAPGTSDRLRVIQLDSTNRPTPGGSRWHIQLQVRAKDVEEWFGAYECTCEVWNQIPALKRVKKVFSENATIKEAYLEREFQLEPIPEQVTVGQRLLLSCQPPRGKPTPNLYWLKDGARVNHSTFPHIVINDYNQLIIEQVTVGDFGNYTCVADTLGIEKRYASAQVTEVEVVRGYPKQRQVQGLWSPWGPCEYNLQGQRRCQQTRFKLCTNGTSNGHLSQIDSNSIDNLVLQSEFLLQREALRDPSKCEPRVVETRECPPSHCGQLSNGRHGEVPMKDVPNRISLREIVFYVGLTAVFFVLLIATHIIVRLARRKPILGGGFRLRPRADRSNEYRKQTISGKVAGTTFSLMSTLPSSACGVQINSPTRGASADSTAKASDSAVLLNATQKTVPYPLPPPPPSTNGFGVSSDFRVTNSDASMAGSTYSQPMFHRTDLTGVSLMNSYTSQNLSSSPHMSTFDSAFGGQSIPLLLSNAAASTPMDNHAPSPPLLQPNQRHLFFEDKFIGPGVVLRSPPLPPPSVSTAPFGGMNLSPNCHTDALYLSTPNTSSLSSESVFYNEIAPSGKSLVGSALEGMPENSEMGTVTWSTVSGFGGRISIPETGIHLYIPADALAPGISREIYLAACRDQKFWPNLTDNQTLLSPVIQFGPPGLPLLKPLVLTFPHCAQVSQGNWSFSILCFCNPHASANAATSSGLSGTNSQSNDSASLGAAPAVFNWTWKEIATVGTDFTLTPGHPQCHIDGQRVHMISQTPMRFCMIGQLAGQKNGKRLDCQDDYTDRHLQREQQWQQYEHSHHHSYGQ
uniref:Netrin receptor UNC5 n=1 Tax=Schistocephalus solidus TaxID=70667 RepID=A0A0X3NMZ1_SCHSO